MKATAKKVQDKVQEKLQEKAMAGKALASKAKAVQAKEEAPEKDAEGAPESPLPLLDLNDAGVKKMIKAAKKRGYVTHEQINAVMPSEEVTSDQIEDVFAMLNDMGINVVETEDADSADEEKAAAEEPDDDEEGGELVEVSAKPVATTEK
jgi:RNA polymerase primary sigma factor